MVDVTDLLGELGAYVGRYVIPMPYQGEDVYIEARQTEGTIVTVWAVVKGVSVWTKENMWEYECAPSGRDDDFLQRARYTTLLEALMAAGRARASMLADPQSISSRALAQQRERATNE